MVEKEEAKKVEIPEEQEESVTENFSNSNNHQNNVDNPILSVCIIVGLVSIISYFVIIGLRKNK